VAWTKACQYVHVGFEAPSVKCIAYASINARSRVAIDEGDAQTINFDLELPRIAHQLYSSIGSYSFGDRNSANPQAIDAVRRLLFSSLTNFSRYDLFESASTHLPPWAWSDARIARDGWIHSSVYTSVLAILAHEVGHACCYGNNDYRSHSSEYLQLLEEHLELIGPKSESGTWGRTYQDDMLFRLQLKQKRFSIDIPSPNLEDWADELVADIQAVECVFSHSSDILTHHQAELADLGLWILMRIYEMQTMLDDLVRLDGQSKFSAFLARRQMFIGLINFKHFMAQQKDCWRPQKISTLSLLFNLWTKDVLLPVFSQVLSVVEAGSKLEQSFLSRRAIEEKLQSLHYSKMQGNGQELFPQFSGVESPQTHQVLNIQRIAQNLGIESVSEWCSISYGTFEASRVV
jgi:hypothetical protein